MSIDHNIYVQLVFSWAPKPARKCESKHWYACGADERSVGRTFTWLPNVLGWVDYHVFFGMGLRPRLTLAVEFRYIKRCLSCVYSNSDNVDTSQNSQL